MEKHKRGKYIGRARRKGELTLQNALEDAYERAMTSKPTDERVIGDTALTLRFKVVGIRIEGSNPISDYIVDLDDD